MINFLSSWVKNLSLALIIVSILEMILPNNNTKKYIKMIMGLYILFSIISPFIENSNKFKDINILNFSIDEPKEAMSDSENIDQSSMDRRLNEIYIDQLQKDIEQKISKKGYEVEKCKVVAYVSKDNSGIENITLKVKAKNITDKEDNENTIEDKIITEIRKIQKVQNVDIGKSGKNEESNITMADIKIIKDFLIDEYGVSERCLKIN